MGNGASQGPAEKPADACTPGLLRIPCRGELGISEITVKAHRGKVMQKMKADSLADSSEDGG